MLEASPIHRSRLASRRSPIQTQIVIPNRTMANGKPVACEANLVRVRTPEGASLRPAGVTLNNRGESIAAQPSPGLSQGERGFPLVTAASLKQGVNRDD